MKREQGAAEAAAVGGTLSCLYTCVHTFGAAAHSSGRRTV